MQFIETLIETMQFIETLIETMHTMQFIETMDSIYLVMFSSIAVNV